MLVLGLLLAEFSLPVPTTRDKWIRPAGATYYRLAPPLSGAYHSAFPYFGNSEDEVSARKIADFEALAGRRIVWAYFSSNWLEGIRFPQAAVRTIHEHGAIPFIRLMSWSRIEQGIPEPTYTLQRIIDGAFDGELAEWADQAKHQPFPLLVEFGTEVNGEWFPWNGKYNGGGETVGYGDPDMPDGPERFRDAYRHIIGLFRERGVENVTWFFHVNAQSWPAASWNRMARYYPGDDCIDWIGVSVYGSQAPGDDWIQFRQILDASYPELSAISTSKPLALLEYGVAEDPERGSKGAWIAQALHALRSLRYPRLKAVSYWHESWENDDGTISDLRINSSPAALAAYRRGIADPFFAAAPRVISLQPPLHPTLQRLENDLVFFKETINRLAWEANPLNTAALSCFRLYRRPESSEDDAYALLAEVAPGVLTYDDRGLHPDERFAYRLVAVDTEGRESEPAVVSN